MPFDPSRDPAAIERSLMSYPSLAERSVVVTGGSRGLGRAMALGLLRAGARVAVVARAKSGPLDATLAQLDAFGARAMVALGDLRDGADCERIAAEVLAVFGRIDVLVNNAAVPHTGPGAPFWQIGVDAWQRMSHTNTDGVFLMTRAVAPSMIAQGFGRIINVSTSDRTLVRRHTSPYGPSKAFVEACSRIWAQDLEGTGVAVNVLLPGGAVDTAADVTGVATPGRRFQPASVMVPPILWLASDDSSGHTGERFVASRWDESLPLAERVVRARDESADVPRIM